MGAYQRDRRDDDLTSRHSGEACGKPDATVQVSQPNGKPSGGPGLSTSEVAPDRSGDGVDEGGR
jgi:hypothetical protein